MAVVYVDYGLLAVERYLMAQGLDPQRHVRTALPQFVDSARMQVAGRFNTALWVLTQFNTTANKKTPSTVLSHNDAAEAGSQFAKALSFCMTIGNKDLTSNCVAMTFSKRRRAGGSLPPCILEIDPLFHRLNDVTATHTLDHRSGRILHKSMANQINGTRPATSGAYTPTGTDVGAMG